MAVEYVVCDRLLDAETNEHCEFDGRLEIGDDGRWTCPGCGRRNYSPVTGADEIRIWFTADTGRCFGGDGYSEQYCSQEFETLEEAKAHDAQFHAAYGQPWSKRSYTKHTEEPTV